MTLSDLITRLEGAEEGSRELDWAIRDQMMEFGWPGDHPPTYTTSVDAALTLVPDGLEIRLDKVLAATMDDPYWEFCCDVSGSGVCRSDTDTKAATFALAICIAALKARLNEKETG